MAADMNAIQSLLARLEPSEQRDAALGHCSATREKIRSSIAAFQFHDRFQQRLQYVSVGQNGISASIENPYRLYNPAEWHGFQQDIPGRHTMATQIIMFDAIPQGKSIEEALASATNFDGKSAEDDIELF